MEIIVCIVSNNSETFIIVNTQSDETVYKPYLLNQGRLLHLPAIVIASIKYLTHSIQRKSRIVALYMSYPLQSMLQKSKSGSAGKMDLPE